MKLPDVNLFLYAADSSSPRHEAARDWVEQALSDSETVAFAWMMLIAYLRLSTNPAVFERPLDLGVALGHIDGWLERPCATVAEPTDRHSAVLGDLLRPLGTAGNLTTDAHLAALSIEHGATVYSCDSDFARFAGVRWVDPLK